jgi:hypothetical protein
MSNINRLVIETMGDLMKIDQQTGVKSDSRAASSEIGERTKTLHDELKSVVSQRPEDVLTKTTSKSPSTTEDFLDKTKTKDIQKVGETTKAAPAVTNLPFPKAIGGVLGAFGKKKFQSDETLSNTSQKESVKNYLNLTGRKSMN